MEFTQQNTQGFSDEELKQLNKDFDALCKMHNVSEGSDLWAIVFKDFLEKKITGCQI